MKKTIKLIVENQQACSLPWYSVEVNFHNNRISPCCKWDHGSEFTLDQNFAETWNGEDFKNLREQIINSEIVENCHKCNDNNKYSYKNFKNKSLKKFYDKDSHVPVTTQAGKIKNLQISCSNICNLVCRMCNPMNSSTWASLVHQNEILKEFVGSGDHIDNKNLRKYIDSLLPELSEVEQITIGGGEPFMDPIVLEMIEHAKKNCPNLKSIGFTTNMTVYNKKLFDLLQSMDIAVTMGVSIDGPKNIHEYIRYKGSFDIIVENLKKIKENYPNVIINANTTCSVLNIGYVKETLETFKWMEEQTGISFRNIKNGIVFEKYLHASLVPLTHRQEYLDKIDSIEEDLLYIPNSRIMISTARTLLSESRNESDYQSMVKFIKIFDNIADTKFENLYWPLD